MNTKDAGLLQASNVLHGTIKQYPPACTYNMDETGLFPGSFLAVRP